MKIYVDEKNQEVRIEWGGKHEHYTRVSPLEGDHEERPAKSLGANTQGTASKVVYETPGYTVVNDGEPGWRVDDPRGRAFVRCSTLDKAQKIADALNATKED